MFVTAEMDWEDVEKTIHNLIPHASLPGPGKPKGKGNGEYMSVRCLLGALSDPLDIEEVQDFKDHMAITDASDWGSWLDQVIPTHITKPLRLIAVLHTWCRPNSPF